METLALSASGTLPGTVEVTQNGEEPGGRAGAHATAGIFEPFFTTKPAGHGAGLWLSMTFDILVQQADRGAVDVNSPPGEFTEFFITLPRGVADGAA